MNISLYETGIKKVCNNANSNTPQHLPKGPKNAGTMNSKSCIVSCASSSLPSPCLDLHLKFPQVPLQPHPSLPIALEPSFHPLPNTLHPLQYRHLSSLFRLSILRRIEQKLKTLGP